MARANPLAVNSQERPRQGDACKTGEKSGSPLKLCVHEKTSQKENRFRTSLVNFGGVNWSFPRVSERGECDYVKQSRGGRGTRARCNYGGQGGETLLFLAWNHSHTPEVPLFSLHFT